MCFEEKRTISDSELIRIVRLLLLLLLVLIMRLLVIS